MPTPPFPHISRWVQFTVHMTAEGSQRAITANYQHNGTTPNLTATQCLQMATAFWNAINSPLTSVLSVNTNVDYVECRDMGSIGAAVAQYLVPQPHAGGVGGDCTPANAAFVISWRSGLAGRSHRGRQYLPSISESLTIGSTVNTAYLIAATALAVAQLGFINPSGIGLFQIIASRKNGTLTAVTSFIADINIDSQRKRLIGRGR